jgi:hypothetical protein
VGLSLLRRLITGNIAEITVDEEQNKDDEISLIDLFVVLWHRKAMIIVITLIAMVGVVIVAVISIKLPAETSPPPPRIHPYRPHAY